MAIAQLFFKKGNFIGEIELDVIINESASASVRVTENPVEYGANVNDHIITEPMAFTMSRCGTFLLHSREARYMAPAATHRGLLPTVKPSLSASSRSSMVFCRTSPGRSRSLKYRGMKSSAEGGVT